MLRLGHLNLTVADRGAAAGFYRRWFGFDRVLAEYGDGTVFVTDRSGFELALHEGDGAANDAWHFGFLAPSADAVIELAGAMRAAGHDVDTVEHDDTYTGFKCRDLDGYEIEVYFEPR